MKYALAYDQKNPAILVSVNREWLMEVLGSEYGCRLISNYELADPESAFEVDSQIGLGFGGVMKPMTEKNPICPESFTQYRLDLPVMLEEEESEECLYCRDTETGAFDCKYCKGTGHHFRMNHSAGDNFGRTLSVVTYAIDLVTSSGLCGSPWETPPTLAEQPLHLAYNYRQSGGEHMIHLWISPDAYLALLLASTVLSRYHITRVEEAIASAYAHIHVNSGPEVRPQAEMERSTAGWLLLGTEDDGGLVQTDRYRTTPFGPEPMEMYSHHLEMTDIAFSVLAGIAALYPILYEGEQGIDWFRHVQARVL